MTERKFHHNPQPIAGMHQLSTETIAAGFCAPPALTKNASLSEERLAAMKECRDHVARELPYLQRATQDYWEKELALRKGAVHVFNQEEAGASPSFTVAIASTADRSEHLLRRLEDLRHLHALVPQERLELIVVLADRELYEPVKMRQLFVAIESLGIPAKVISSLHNNISTNRNLAISECGSGTDGLILFLDDDVYLPALSIRQLIDTSRRNPEVGVLTIPSLSPVRLPHKPNQSYCIDDLNSEVLALDRYGGMVGVISTKLARAVPFCEGVEIGDDNVLGMQLHGMGFLIGCVKNPIEPAIHEEAPVNASLAHHNFWKYLAYGATLRFLEPDGFEKFNARTARHRISGLVKDEGLAAWHRAWDDFCLAGSLFLSGTEGGEVMMKPTEDASLAAQVQKATEYLTTMREWLSDFGRTQYNPLKISSLPKGAYFGPFEG